MAGAARASVDHGGLEAGELRGGLEAKVSFGDVRLDSVTGPAQVEVDHGGLRGKGLAGGGRLRVSGDDVSVDGFRGPLQVEARRGSVELVPSGPLTEALDVSTQNGGVRLEVPERSAFELLASASRGEVQADLPGLSAHERSPDRITGTLGGGGARVSLSARHGDVVLIPGEGAP